MHSASSILKNRNNLTGCEWHNVSSQFYHYPAGVLTSSAQIEKYL